MTRVRRPPRRPARAVAGLVLLLLAAVGAIAQAHWPARSQAPLEVTGARDARMAWWREARFGLFIHWGLYAVPAGAWNGRTDYGEWIRSNAQIPLDVYDGFRATFNPQAFDPTAWARLARRAGMKYVVITTKHHDGFSLFDSKESDFTVMQTPFKRDVMREVADAFRREGLKVGWYHSIMDWHHPDYLPRRDWEAQRPAAGATFDRYVRYMKAQIKELLTNYGPIDVMWFDGQWEATWSRDRGRNLYDYVRSLRPGVVVNNRVSSGDFGADGRRIGDFGTPEQEIPATGVPGLDWETCMTMNRNWGFNRADKEFKPAKELVRNLVDIASKGGNFLLNVGPDADGRFPAESVERLEAIGAWMDVNDTSIHGTSASPFPSLPWGRCTRRRLPDGSTRLYLHVFDWPADGRLVVDGLLNQPRAVYLLGDGRGLEFAAGLRATGRIEIKVPAKAPDAIDTVVVLDVNGEPDVAVAPVLTAGAPVFIREGLVETSSSQRGVEIRYTTDGTEPSAASPVASAPLRLTQTSTVTARSFRGSTVVSPSARITLTKVVPRVAVSPDTLPGLAVECLLGDYDRLPDFDRLPRGTAATARTFSIDARARPHQFALRFRGFVRVPAEGVYRFFTRSDDGSRLWIGDTLVVENDGLHGASEASGAIALSAGLHPITVGMFDQSGDVELTVSYAGSGLEKQPIPATALSRSR
jgi:alpha-L-fucosidase